MVAEARHLFARVFWLSPVSLYAFEALYQHTLDIARTVEGASGVWSELHPEYDQWSCGPTWKAAIASRANTPVCGPSILSGCLADPHDVAGNACSL
jgi:hypothetical protein